MWEEVLEEYRGASGSPEIEEERQQCQPFRFLDLPAELRNIIYLYYLKDTQIIENKNDMQEARQHGIADGMGRADRFSLKWLPTMYQRTRYQSKEEEVQNNIKKLMPDHEEFAETAYNACNSYMPRWRRLT